MQYSYVLKDPQQFDQVIDLQVIDLSLTHVTVQSVARTNLHSTDGLRFSDEKLIKQETLSPMDCATLDYKTAVLETKCVNKGLVDESKLHVALPITLLVLSLRVEPILVSHTVAFVWDIFFKHLFKL
jgi:hypothetical protein